MISSVPLHYKNSTAKNMQEIKKTLQVLGLKRIELKPGLNILPDVPTSKALPLLWSPDTERTQSGSHPSHSAVKKPAFNLSVFGTTSSVSALSSQ